jgi:hypothetical protein
VQQAWDPEFRKTQYTPQKKKKKRKFNPPLWYCLFFRKSYL